MERFGGHAQAIGLSVATDRLEELRAEWEVAGEAWPPELLARRGQDQVPPAPRGGPPPALAPPELLARRVEYELHLEPREVSPRLLAQLGALEPFGQGNPRPLLRTGPLRLDGVPRNFGKGHLSARARGGGGRTRG